MVRVNAMVRVRVRHDEWVDMRGRVRVSRTGRTGELLLVADAGG